PGRRRQLHDRARRALRAEGPGGAGGHDREHDQAHPRQPQGHEARPGPADPGARPAMKLYSGDLSPYSARVRMQIYAKGITDITLESPADFGLPAFRQDNPIGRIPVLDIDGDRMPESEVIAEYLEEVYPTPPLLGTT